MLTFSTALSADCFFDQPNNFRSLVSESNPNLALLTSLLSLPDSFSISNSNMLLLRKILKKDEKIRKCDICLMYTNLEQAKYHKKICATMPLYKRVLPCLYISGKFMCHVGCEQAVFETNVAMYEHFWEEHTKEELAVWSINWKILESEFGTIKWL